MEERQTVPVKVREWPSVVCGDVPTHGILSDRSLWIDHTCSRHSGKCGQPFWARQGVCLKHPKMEIISLIRNDALKTRSGTGLDFQK